MILYHKKVKITSHQSGFTISSGQRDMRLKLPHPCNVKASLQCDFHKVSLHSVHYFGKEAYTVKTHTKET